MMYRTNLNRTLSRTYVSVSFFFSYMMPPLLLLVFVVHVLNTCAISYQNFALRLLLPHPLIRFLCFSPPFRSPEETAVNGGHSELVCCGVREKPVHTHSLVIDRQARDPQLVTTKLSLKPSYALFALDYSL